MENMREIIRVDTYAHNWGFIIPCENGVFWEQQTGGVCCHHVSIEGIFIPLNEPNELLTELEDLNYRFKSTTDVWRRIKKKMHFNFRKIDAPPHQPDNQEGIQWIVLKRFDSEMEHLVGKVLCLIYPNCD